MHSSCFRATYARRARSTIVTDGDTTPQPLDCFVRRHALDLGQVNFWDATFCGGNVTGESPSLVSSNKPSVLKSSLPTGCKRPSDEGIKSITRRPPFGIRHAGQITFGLVKQDVDGLLLAQQRIDQAPFEP
jgi:hypothetical protein